LKAVNQEARIKSFEPTSFSFAVAEKVARVFEDCEVFNFGLSDEPATLPIYTPVIDGLLITPLTSLDPAMFEPGGTMHAFLTNDIAKGAPVSIYREDVRLECGDDLALDPDVMKIDVEGAELRVLKGLSKTIARCQPLIMTEKSDAPAISAYLAKFGYFPCRYESARPADTRTLFRLPIDAATDPAAIPLNVFYVQKGKVALYKAEFGLQFE
jgi:FkbM family methyltransferase